jgi:hypothetical protein
MLETMTYDQQCRRLVRFIKELNVGFAGVSRQLGQQHWSFVVYLPKDHVVCATGPEQPKAPKSKPKSKTKPNQNAKRRA